MLITQRHRDTQKNEVEGAMIEIFLSPSKLVVLLQVGPHHHADCRHLLALLFHHQLSPAPVGHREPNTVVLQNTTDLRTEIIDNHTFF